MFKKAKKTGSFLKTSLVRGVWFWAYMILGAILLAIIVVVPILVALTIGFTPFTIGVISVTIGLSILGTFIIWGWASAKATKRVKVGTRT